MSDRDWMWCLNKPHDAAEYIAALESALHPFAGIKADDGDTFGRYPGECVIRCEVTAGEVRAARDALRPSVQPTAPRAEWQPLHMVTNPECRYHNSRDGVDAECICRPPSTTSALAREALSRRVEVSDSLVTKIADEDAQLP